MRLSAREAALAIVRRLRERGFEAYFVGGCVRDWLLGREGYEQRNHDIATSASPDEVSRLFPRVVPVGRRFGVMLVLQDGHCVDVATFRTETGYRDGRRPTGVRFSSRREDVRRRDFTGALGSEAILYAVAPAIAAKWLFDHHIYLHPAYQ